MENGYDEKKKGGRKATESEEIGNETMHKMDRMKEKPNWHRPCWANVGHFEDFSALV